MSLVTLPQGTVWDTSLDWDAQADDAREEVEYFTSVKEPETTTAISASDPRAHTMDWLYLSDTAGAGYKIRMTLSYPYPLTHARALQSEIVSINIITL